MFEKKITLKRVNEIADQLRAELEVEINRVIEARNNTDVERDIESLYNYQHALEHSRMNVTTLVHRIRMDVNY